jgi:hypothetical protein
MGEMMISRPVENEFAPYYMRYISLVPEDDLLSVLQNQLADLTLFAAAVAPEYEKYCYAPGKWSLREVVGHLIDSERVFGYRAFCISRGDTALLAIFDENLYVAMSRYDERPLPDLVLEFELIRRSNLLFLAQLTDDAWKRMGSVGNNPVSVRALAFIMAGHVRHHLNIMLERYSVSGGV